MDAPSGEMAEQRVRSVPPNLARNTCFGAADSFIMPLCPFDGRERVRRGPSRPAPDPLTEPPHVQPPGVIAEQQRRRRRPRPRLRSASPRFASAPFFFPFEGVFAGTDHVPPPVIASGVLCGTLTTRTGCLFRNSPPGTPGAARRSPERARWHPPACPLPPPPPADGGAAAIANARTSCVCGLFVPVKVHLSNPRSSGGTRSNAATCASTPEAKTTFPSGDAASARTSALVLPVRAELRAVLRVPEGDVAVAAAADEGTVGRYWSAHTHRSSDSRPGRPRRRR